MTAKPQAKCSISQFFKTNCTHSIFRTVRSTRGLLAKPFKKFSKSPIRPAGSHFWQAPNFQWALKELPFNIIKNLLCLFFCLMVLKRCVILKSVWYAVRVKGGMSLRNGMWHGLRNDIIMRNVKYGKWRKEIN